MVGDLIQSVRRPSLTIVLYTISKVSFARVELCLTNSEDPRHRSKPIMTSFKLNRHSEGQCHVLAASFQDLLRARTLRHSDAGRL